MNFPTRKKNRMDGYDYSLCGAYFVTICTKDKAHILWDNVGADIIRPNENIELSECGKIIDSAINEIPLHYPYVFVDKYVIMPDHIHMIICIRDRTDGRTMHAPTLSGIIAQMKAAVTKKLGFSLWQKSFHDHIIRNEQDYKEISRYIEENPLKYNSRKTC